MKNLKEQSLVAKKTDDGKILINGQKYKLQVEKPIVGWVNVNIDNIEQTNDGWRVTASKLGSHQTDIVPSDTINIIKQNLGSQEIKLGGKTPKKLVKEMKKRIVKLTENDLESLVRKVLKEQESPNYMFFSNLEQIKRQCEKLLELEPEVVDEILLNGHDWADDHVTEAKTNMDQVFDFMMNETKKMKSYIEYEDISEGKKKTGTKLCSRGKSAAKAKFKVYPSAYANGYAVQVCKGKMPGTDGKKKCSAPYC